MQRGMKKIAIFDQYIVYLENGAKAIVTTEGE